MPIKLVNGSEYPVTIRLVKRQAGEVILTDNLAPKDSVNNESEFSFSLAAAPKNGPFEYVLGTANSANIKNPEQYITNGDSFSITSNAYGEKALHAEFGINITDPNYNTKKLGVFLKFNHVSAPYVLATVSPTHTVTNILGQEVSITKATVLNSVGQYFNDADYYIPLFLGTLEELVTSWLVENKLTMPSLRTSKEVGVGNDLDITVDLPITSITITNTDLFTIGSQVDITTAELPSKAVIVNRSYLSSNPVIASFGNPPNRLSVHKYGNVDITVTATDNIGNQLSTVKTVSTQFANTPIVLTTTNGNGTLSLTTTSPDTYVDWGDGNIETISGYTLSHSYTDSKVRTVKVWLGGDHYIVSAANQALIKTVNNWGNNQIDRFELKGCVNLTSVPLTAPLGIIAMDDMFNGCAQFNSPLTNWDISAVTTMYNAFFGCSLFNQPVNHLATGNVTDMTGAFQQCAAFNQPVNLLDMHKVQTADYMFKGASKFNQAVSSWITSALSSVRGMFDGATAFNQEVTFAMPLVTSLEKFLSGAIAFNKPINHLLTASITDVSGMLQGCSAFNSAVVPAVTHNVTTFANFLDHCVAFNQPLNSLDVSSANDISYMLSNCSLFNQPLNNWDVRKVVNAEYLFNAASVFTSNLSGWVFEQLQLAGSMFKDAAIFTSNLNWWCVSNIAATPDNFATGSLLVEDQYPVWGTCPNHNLVATIVGAGNTIVNDTSGTFEIETNPVVEIISTKWTSSDPSVIIVDEATGEYVAVGEGDVTISALVNRVYEASISITVTEQLAKSLLYAKDMVAVRIDTGSTATIDWGDGSPVVEGTVGNDYSHSYAEGSSYPLTIATPESSHIAFAGGVSTISDYGINNLYADLVGPFNRTDLVAIPDVLPPFATKLSFAGCYQFNQDISDMDVSHVTDMTSLFDGATEFNQSIGNWDITNVQHFDYAFRNAIAFNQDLSAWNPSSAVSAEAMFLSAAAFSSNLSWWCVPLIVSEPESFGSGSLLTDVDLPIWGTCPARTAMLSLVAPESIALSDTESVVTYTLTPDITTPHLVWSSSDESILQVSQTGALTPIATGGATITLTVNQTLHSSVDIGVGANAGYIEDMVRIWVDGDITAGLVRNINAWLDESIVPESVAWSSDDESIAFVNSSNLAEGVSPGSTYLQVIVNDRYIARCEVTVIPAEPAKKLVGTVGANMPFTIVTTSPYDVKIDGVAVPQTRSGKDYIYHTDTTAETDREFVVTLDRIGTPLNNLNCVEGVIAIKSWDGVTFGAVAGAERSMINLGASIISVPDNLPPTLTDLSSIFNGADNFNDPNVCNWDTSNVTRMLSIFSNTNAFNQPIGVWDVSKVIDFTFAFADATVFDQDLSLWCVPDVNVPRDQFSTGSALTDEHLPVWGTCPINPPVNALSDGAVSLTFNTADTFIAHTDQGIVNDEPKTMSELIDMVDGTDIAINEIVEVDTAGALSETDVIDLYGRWYVMINGALISSNDMSIDELITELYSRGIEFTIEE